MTDLSHDYCTSLIDSTPRRIQAIIDNNGFATEYWLIVLTFQWVNRHFSFAFFVFKLRWILYISCYKKAESSLSTCVCVWERERDLIISFSSPAAVKITRSSMPSSCQNRLGLLFKFVVRTFVHKNRLGLLFKIVVMTFVHKNRLGLLLKIVVRTFVHICC